MAARIGGEEFALILPGSGLLQAEASLERLLNEARERKVTCAGVDAPVGVTCSVGLVCTKGEIAFFSGRARGYGGQSPL